MTHAVVGLAVGVALVETICSAIAAVLQHRAARGVADGTGVLGVRTIGRLIARPGWLVAIALMLAAGGLHVVALDLAPISIIQPIGIVAIPLTILIAARLSRHAPRAVTWLAVGLCMIGLAGFVLATATFATDSPLGFRRTHTIVITCGLTALAAVALVAASAHRTARTVAVLRAVAGAALYGLVSVLVRMLATFLTPMLATGHLHLMRPRLWILAGGIAVSAVLGSFWIQQAYAAGSAELVLAAVTVVDPLIGVSMGLYLLNEGTRMAPLDAAALIASSLVAMAGIALLSRYHAHDLAPAPRPMPTTPRSAALG